MQTEEIRLRPARPEDQIIIRRLVCQARLNPFDLHWSRFQVIEAGEQVVGVGQIRHHGDGTRELASLVVDPAWRGRGLGSILVRALMAQEPGPLYLVCRRELEGFYQRFGFQRISGQEMPPRFRWIDRMARLFGRSWIVMRWVP
ncbi:GNAT family N-acetyltransferase [Thermoflexus sp.]|uniref:GNAT family N-acetyltransferase n=1 Tax=Thermoflexus sp. TaxID=1969742 RepID=UPI0025DEF143|nr:GNAT family N-acetyltransferase [Thermoflexus sp.]MDW8181198.1 GNAT family N-acetyltransferase [Anaerolineae bacterium]MCS6964699.1 GNAT family N-acetyltransferase [Thermoflexus sp.]MCS7351740.1 GNAT family N-acetyltransferase [Thermoflexus sp.]MCX7689558.1 GNAT family N-acetyltransferase [Thermoflexus sp.]MDW8184598.1 GNAT family N-acetyltransferase [Anaerolineae bacterium]